MADDPHQWFELTSICHRCGCTRQQWDNDEAPNCVRVTAAEDFSYIARRMRDIEKEEDGLAADKLIVLKAVQAERARREAMAAQKAECEQDLLAFIRMFWPVLEPETELIEGWVLEQMCDLLMAIADGHMNRVILNVFPGAMKSLTLNVFFPAWLWGPCNRPHTRFLSASYSASLTERDNGKMVRLVTDADYVRWWGERFHLTKDGVGKVENSRTGFKLATSVGGTVTGERADYVLIDDANNPQTVESDTVRESTNRWLREVMPTRLNDPKRSTIINLQQRTHAEDATGTLAEHGAGYHWWVVSMEYDPLRDAPIAIRWDEDGAVIQMLEDPRGRTPKVYDEDGNWVGGGEKLEGEFLDERGALKIRHGSPLAQADGELAWPDRYPVEEVQKLKTILGPYAYAGQFLQMPSARGGGIIRRDWWQLWTDDKFPDLGTVIGVLDTAIKEAEQNDFNAFQSWGAFADSRREGAPAMMLTTAWKGRMSLAELVARTYESCWEQKVDYLLIEDKARGHDVAAEMQRQYVEVPWQTILIPANGRGSFSGDKVARLTAVSPLFSGDVRKDHNGIDVWSGGMIYAPDKDWADAVIDEVSQFPRGAHDDHVDCTSMALSWVRRHGVVLRKPEYDRRELEKKRYRRPPSLPYSIRGQN